MARPKAFDTDEALDAAVAVFRDHGYEGSSASMLVGAMGIGRQSLYDSFGDKWQLYCAALRRYTTTEVQAHLQTLRREERAIDGIRARGTRPPGLPQATARIPVDARRAGGYPSRGRH